MPTNCVPAVTVFGVGCKSHLSLCMMRKVKTLELDNCRNKEELGGLYCQSVLFLTYSGVNRLQPTELGPAASKPTATDRTRTCCKSCHRQFIVLFLLL